MRILLFLITAFCCTVAFAHTPVCECKLKGRQVICEGAYHDGSGATGVTMAVMGYDGISLATGVLDRQSRYQFDLPTVPFYLLMDAGPGEIFEVDWRDISDINWNQFSNG